MLPIVNLAERTISFPNYRRSSFHFIFHWLDISSSTGIIAVLAGQFKKNSKHWNRFAEGMFRMIRVRETKPYEETEHV